MRKLFSPATKDSDYAMGWLIGNERWAGGVAYTHSGSNSMWYATAWLAPLKDSAILVACNQGGNAACDEVVDAIIGE